MICKYCQHDHGELHECDIDDLKENISEQAELIADQTAIICSYLEAGNAVETTH